MSCPLRWLRPVRAGAGMDKTTNQGFKMASANDMKAARATYEGFIGLIKISVPVIAVIVAFVIYLIH